MSYILDALKKSEQERKKGTVPGLGTVQGLPAHRFGNDWPRRYYLPVTLVLLAILVVLSWLYLREPLPSQTKIAAPTPPPPLTAAPAPTPTATPAPKAALPEKPPSSSRAEDGHRAVKLTTPPAAAPLHTLKLKPTPGASSKSAPPTKVSTPPVVQPPPKAEPPRKMAVTETIPPTTMNETAPFQPLPETAKPENDPPPTEEAEVVIKPEDMPVVPLTELPPEIKGIMPEIKIGIHFFSDDPASRRAGINGRLLHEGQQVEKDIMLKEITRDGAILSFQGRRFSLAVFPR